MAHITANELKTKGVACIGDALRDGGEALISVRGKPQYVVMSIDEFEALREGQLLAAWQEARAEYDRGDLESTTAADHIARLKSELG